jgi:hypothetical protein
MFYLLSGMRESNPRYQFGKLMLYHLTNPAWGAFIIPQARVPLKTIPGFFPAPHGG